MKSGIYLIVNVINHKEYVGRTKSLTRRKYQHWEFLKNGKHANPHLQNAYDKYGEDAFHFLIVEYCEVEELRSREQWWIDLLRTCDPKRGYNVMGSEGLDTHSTESKIKMSITRKGWVPSEEVRKKISNTLSGRSLSDERRMNISNAMKDKPKSKEHRKNLSIALKGRQLKVETRKKMSTTKLGRPGNAAKEFPGLVSPDGECYPIITNLSEFCREHGGLDMANVHNVITEKRKSCRGWTKYIGE